MKDEESSNMVYTIGTSKGYIEKEPTISLETLAMLEKRGSAQKSQKKECQISEMNGLHPRKLRGNMAIIDQTIAAPEKVESQYREELNTIQGIDSIGKEHSMEKVTSNMMEKFISQSDVSESRQLPSVNRNFFKVGNCYQCKKRKLVFQSYANYMPQSCQKTFCAECLKDYYGEDIYEIIQTRTHWSTPFKRKICKTPSAILSTDTTGCKPEVQTEEEEKVYVVDTYLKSFTKKTLELNSTLIKRLERSRSSLTTEEKMLGLKIIHDNLESLLSIKGAVFNQKFIESTGSVERQPYVSLVNDISRDLEQRTLQERDEKYGMLFEESRSEFEDDRSDLGESYLNKADGDATDEVLGKRDASRLASIVDNDSEDAVESNPKLPAYRVSKLRFEDFGD
jgi:Zinc-finger domain of monoamine-oxidase A repressor R1